MSNDERDGFFRRWSELNTARTATPPPSGRRRRTRRLLMMVLVLAVAGTITGVAAGYLITGHLSGNVRRIDGAFQGIDPSQRPAPAPSDDGGQTILAVGLDVRSDDQTTGQAATDPQASQSGDRSDTIMLVRFDSVRRSAAVVSIPRDSWVDIPGQGTMKINAAYARGGPPLLIRTVEQLTGVRIDHFMVIDFAGFRSVVDALGGVDIQVSQDTTDLAGNRFQRGTDHLDGRLALAYVRQRHGLPDGDLDRVRRQQSFLRAVFVKASAADPAADPVEAYHLLDAFTQSITVDTGYTDGDLRQLAVDAMKLDGNSIWFLTAPVSGEGMEGDQSVVYLDKTRDAQLWQAMRTDAIGGYVTVNPADLLPATTP
ncbi:MAG TPA: LCP family protein [Rugosimonospora sp.]|jgi:LCP family protein required for cell wall assembly